MSQPLNNSTSTSGAAIEDKALDKESVISLLGEDDKEEQETLELEKPEKAEKPEKVVKADKEDKEDKTKDDKPEEEEELTLEDELEEELREVDESKLELIEPPSRKEILAAYPDLFKKFPDLEKSIYREKAYSELLPTIKDAKLAVEKATMLDRYDEDLSTGSMETILSTVKNNDREVFAKIVDNYMPNLFKADQNAYYHTVGNMIKHTIISMIRDSKQEGQEELGEAAAVINKYIFGTDKFIPPTKLSQEDVQDDATKKKSDEVTQREREFVQRQFTTAKDDLSTRVDNILKATVDKAIDPNESMTGYVKGVATDKVLSRLEDIISKDTRFKSLYDRLWEKAFESDFSKESMDKIKSAYLSKAKTLLPELIKRERSEALKGNNRSTDGKDRKGPLPVGKTRSSTTLASGKPNSESGSKSIPKGMTTLEYLNSD